MMQIITRFPCTIDMINRLEELFRPIEVTRVVYVQEIGETRKLK